MRRFFFGLVFIADLVIRAQGFANNKGADQPASAHPRSLISTFVIHLLESIISRLAASEISIF